VAWDPAEGAGLLVAGLPGLGLGLGLAQPVLHLHLAHQVSAHHLSALLTLLAAFATLQQRITTAIHSNQEKVSRE